MSLLLNLAYWIPYQHSSSGTVLIYSFHLSPSWLITLLVMALFQVLSKGLLSPPSLKRHLCPTMTLRITAQCLVFVSSQSWLSELLLSNLRHTSISTNWIIHISQPISQDILLKQLFYCVNTSYPMDNFFTGRRDRSR